MCKAAAPPVGLVCRTTQAATISTVASMTASRQPDSAASGAAAEGAGAGAAGALTAIAGTRAVPDPELTDRAGARADGVSGGRPAGVKSLGFSQHQPSSADSRHKHSPLPSVTATPTDVDEQRGRECRFSGGLRRGGAPGRYWSRRSHTDGLLAGAPAIGCPATATSRGIIHYWHQHSKFGKHRRRSCGMGFQTYRSRLLDVELRV